MSKPKIRFKGYCNDWERRKLGEIITEYKETVDSDCTLPILTSSKTEGVILQEEHFGRKQQHDIAGYNILPRNYCTYRNRSDGVDFTFNINKCCDKGIISKFYPVFSGNNSDVFFLSLVLNNSEEVVHEIAYTCTGTGQKVLSFLDLQKMRVRVPSFEEQKKVGEIITTLDHLITLHQRQCENAKKLKKFMLQKMFPKKNQKNPEIRFAGFTNDWERRKLGELVEIGDIDHRMPETVADGIPYLMTGDFVGTNELNFDGTKMISEEDYCQLSQKIKPEKGDILFARYASVGAARYVDFTRKFLISYSCAIIKKSKKINSKYLYYFITSDNAQQQIKLEINTGSQANIGIDSMKNHIMVSMPPLEEQTKIADVLSNLDCLITLHQNKGDELKKLKKFMLQNMFI